MILQILQLIKFSNRFEDTIIFVRNSIITQNNDDLYHNNTTNFNRKTCVGIKIWNSGLFLLFPLIIDINSNSINFMTEIVLTKYYSLMMV